MEPMLACPSSTVAATAADAVAALCRSGLWMFELKLDGIRCMASVVEGVATLRGRAGGDITYRYPEIKAALEDAFAQEDIELDGELIVYHPDGRANFPAVHKRDAQQTVATANRAAAATPACYVIFDMPDKVHATYAQRRELLESLYKDRTLPHDHLELVTSHADGQTMWDFVLEHRLEGLVAKRRDSLYRSGRSQSWVKLKPVRRLSALVSGVVPAEGQRTGFGALELSLIDATTGKLQGIGKVGSGFSAQELRQVAVAVTKGPLIVDIDYMEVSPNGQLRFPVFVSTRSDINILDCTTEQLNQ